MTPVTDPEILAQLEGKALKPVTDSKILAQLNGEQGVLDKAKGVASDVMQAQRDAAMGAVKGAANIGSTILAPADALYNTVARATGNQPMSPRRERVGEFFQQNSNPESLAFKGGELGAEIAGTAGVGRALASGIARFAPVLASALESGGLKLGVPAAHGVAGKVGQMATRTVAGAAVGGVSAGLVNPDTAGTGAAIGGALPGAVKVAGAAGNALAPKVSQEVQGLAQKAKQVYGIDIPADRIVDSRPLNAVAASLNYIPFSGRAAAEEKMVDQVYRAVSNTFGQNTPNVVQALRQAQSSLGGQFDQALSQNAVRVDVPFMNDLLKHMQRAADELAEPQARIIGKQIDELISRSGGLYGTIDGQAAYNVKKTLDRIGNRNSPEAFYARDLKRSLMDALDRSLGPQQSASFKNLRQQYSAMLDVEGIVLNGAEGGVSVGRLANMKDINSPQLRELADISAQFIKARENPHGAAQRVVMGALGAAGLGGGAMTGTLPLVAGAMAAGRGVNALLNSNVTRNALLSNQPPQALNALNNPALRALTYVGGANP